MRLLNYLKLSQTFKRIFTSKKDLKKRSLVKSQRTCDICHTLFIPQTQMRRFCPRCFSLWISGLVSTNFPNPGHIAYPKHPSKEDLDFPTEDHAA